MGQFERGSFLGVILEEEEPGQATVLCLDCFEKEDEKHKIEEVLIQEVLENGDLFVCDECGQQIRLKNVEAIGKEFNRNRLKSTKKKNLKRSLADGEEVTSVLSKAVEKGLVSRFKNYSEKK